MDLAAATDTSMHGMMDWLTDESKGEDAAASSASAAPAAAASAASVAIVVDDGSSASLLEPQSHATPAVASAAEDSVASSRPRRAAASAACARILQCAEVAHTHVRAHNMRAARNAHLKRSSGQDNEAAIECAAHFKLLCSCVWSAQSHAHASTEAGKRDEGGSAAKSAAASAPRTRKRARAAKDDDGSDDEQQGSMGDESPAEGSDEDPTSESESDEPSESDSSAFGSDPDSAKRIVARKRRRAEKISLAIDQSERVHRQLLGRLLSLPVLPRQNSKHAGGKLSSSLDKAEREHFALLNTANGGPQDLNRPASQGLAASSNDETASGSAIGVKQGAPSNPPPPSPKKPTAASRKRAADAAAAAAGNRCATATAASSSDGAADVSASFMQMIDSSSSSEESDFSQITPRIGLFALALALPNDKLGSMLNMQGAGGVSFMQHLYRVLCVRHVSLLTRNGGEKRLLKTMEKYCDWGQQDESGSTFLHTVCSPRTYVLVRRWIDSWVYVGGRLLAVPPEPRERTTSTKNRARYFSTRLIELASRMKVDFTMADPQGNIPLLQVAQLWREGQLSSFRLCNSFIKGAVVFDLNFADSKGRTFLHELFDLPKEGETRWNRTWILARLIKHLSENSKLLQSIDLLATDSRGCSIIALMRAREPEGYWSNCVEKLFRHWQFWRGSATRRFVGDHLIKDLIPLVSVYELGVPWLKATVGQREKCMRVQETSTLQQADAQAADQEAVTRAQEARQAEEKREAEAIALDAERTAAKANYRAASSATAAATLASKFISLRSWLQPASKELEPAPAAAHMSASDQGMLTEAESGAAPAAASSAASASARSSRGFKLNLGGALGGESAPRPVAAHGLDVNEDDDDEEEEQTAEAAAADREEAAAHAEWMAHVAAQANNPPATADDGPQPMELDDIDLF